MPQATFVREGNTIDYTPAATVATGAVVVQGELVGVAKVEIPAGRPGALAVAGVFDFPKATSFGSAIGVGLEVYWDAGLSLATTSAAGNKRIGKTIKAAADSDPTVRVRLSQ